MPWTLLVGPAVLGLRRTDWNDPMIRLAIRWLPESIPYWHSYLHCNSLSEIEDARDVPRKSMEEENSHKRR